MSLTPLGKALRDFRCSRHLLLGNMAKALEVSAADLSAYETGRKVLNPGTFVRFMRRLDDIYHIGQDIPPEPHWRDIFEQAYKGN